MTEEPRIRWTDKGEEWSVGANEVATLQPGVHNDQREGAMLQLRSIADDVWIPKAALPDVERQINEYLAAGLMPHYIRWP